MNIMFLAICSNKLPGLKNVSSPANTNARARARTAMRREAQEVW